VDTENRGQGSEMLVQMPYLRTQVMEKKETDLPLGAICPVWEAIRVKLATVAASSSWQAVFFRPK
jgi:hypothetical protein